MKNELTDRAGLAGNDRGGRGAGAIDSEPFLDFGHGLLGGELGEASSSVLAGEIPSSHLLHAGGGEEGDGDGGEQRCYQKDEDEGAAGIGGFNHNRAPGEAGDGAIADRPEWRGRGHERVKGHVGGGKRKVEGGAAGSGASRVHGAARLVGVEGDEAAHGDGALGDEALDRGE